MLSIPKARKQCVFTVRKKELVSPAMNRERTLRAFNTSFLRLAGYSRKQVSEFGDLSRLTSEQMYELVHAKTLEAQAIAAARKMRAKFTVL